MTFYLTKNKVDDDLKNSIYSFLKHYYMQKSDMFTRRKFEEALVIFPQRLKNELDIHIKKPML